jgi:hypothetical protein
MAKRHRGKLELDWVDKGDIIVTKFDGKNLMHNTRVYWEVK